MSLADKLVAQWKLHGKLIVAFDFDDTVFPYSTVHKTPVIRRTIKALQDAKNQGHTLVLFTCRDSQEDTRMYCDINGIGYDYFNESPVPTGNGKIFYNVFLDDKCGLRETVTELQIALHEIEDLIREKSKRLHVHSNSTRRVRGGS